jgi:hypothetical protein
MNDSDDALRRLVRSLDPVSSDPPPAQGSDRYRSILETAMHADESPPMLTAEESPTPPARRRPRRRWPYALTAAAVVLVVGGVGAVVVVRQDAPSPQVTVSDAVAGLEEITSLEVELTQATPESNRNARLRIDGDAMQSTSRGTYADGHVEESTQTIVDGVAYETIGGETTRTDIEPGQGLAPFGRSSDAVLAAATTDSEINELGTERVGDISAVRYFIALTPQAVAALSALPENQLAWFELGYPDRVSSMSVWIADGLIHQVEIMQDGQVIQDDSFVHPIERSARTTRIRFFNFNGDVRVEAPPGPYVDSGG